MAGGQVKNIAASVRQRLLNKSRGDCRPFQEVLQYFAMERFLFRLSMSPYRDKFCLKGALLMRVWNMDHLRATMDIDLLGKKIQNDLLKIKGHIKTICEVRDEEAGIVFDSSTIVCERITEGAEYHGVRVRLKGNLDSAVIPMQIDIGFGDEIIPEASDGFLPTILDHIKPKLLCYSKESVIAEKFEAMIKLGELNSRLKDFYDVWLLARQYNFNGEVLSEALNATFSARGTKWPDEIVPFSKKFTNKKQKQWVVFCSRIQDQNAPGDFGRVISVVSTFLSPVVNARSQDKLLKASWNASTGQWV